MTYLMSGVIGLLLGFIVGAWWGWSTCLSATERARRARPPSIRRPDRPSWPR